MIDCDGYRPNVGIILCNQERQVFWAKRAGQEAWQFPQGGIRRHETPLEAMYRELEEETGLLPDHVKMIGHTRDWLRYKLPKHLIRHSSHPICIGQKQIWFMLRLVGDEVCVRLDTIARPEFDSWRWVEYWYPMREVVFFKRHVYRRALREFAPLIFDEHEVKRARQRLSLFSDTQRF
ncbi:RNA pyrophosphohydrolase [Thiorhodospira sibirica]|uniref:RNA pyrophosphohydrolase n=1 Tax=Thiorhodospira sibirica TaxID=154347 RepID=UPI00022C4693|nr:RNA pyrophosphohydrolase [Thiorhodospira sibirica]